MFTKTNPDVLINKIIINSTGQRRSPHALFYIKAYVRADDTIKKHEKNTIMSFHGRKYLL